MLMILEKLVNRLNQVGSEKELPINMDTTKIMTLNGIVRYSMYFRRIFVESMKIIHFWKAYGIGNQKNNVSVCPESNMAAILHSTKWPP